MEIAESTFNKTAPKVHLICSVLLKQSKFCIPWNPVSVQVSRSCPALSFGRGWLFPGDDAGSLWVGSSVLPAPGYRRAGCPGRAAPREHLGPRSFPCVGVMGGRGDGPLAVPRRDVGPRSAVSSPAGCIAEPWAAINPSTQTCLMK